MECTLSAQQIQRFAAACDAARMDMTQRQEKVSGIGTLCEKSLHAAVKRFYEPLGEMHEYRVGLYVADIVNEHGITEIQTGNFSALPKKLDAFLRVAPVTLVYPIVHQRMLCYVQASTGEIFSRTRSPKQGQYTDAFWELYQIIPYLFHPQLTLHLLLVDVEEIRLCPNAGQAGKCRAKKGDRIPTGLYGMYHCHTHADYLGLLPNIAQPFTAKMFARALKRSEKRAGYTLSCCRKMGLIRQESQKQGRAFLYSYETVQPENETAANES